MRHAIPSAHSVDLADGGEIGVLEERAHADVDGAARYHGLFVGQRIDDDAGGLRERFGEIGFFAREDEVDIGARIGWSRRPIAVPAARRESRAGRREHRHDALRLERAKIAKRFGAALSTAFSSAASVPAGSPMSVASPGCSCRAHRIWTFPWQPQARGSRSGAAPTLRPERLDAAHLLRLVLTPPSAAIAA